MWREKEEMKNLEEAKEVKEEGDDDSMGEDTNQVTSYWDILPEELEGKNTMGG